MADKKTPSSEPSKPKQHPAQAALNMPEQRSERTQDAANGNPKGIGKAFSPFELGTLILSSLALLAAIITAYFVYGQLEEMRVGMRLDQRAWVGFSDETIIPAADEKGKFFKLGLTIKNTGKTPALNVSVESITAPALRDTPPTWEGIDKNWKGSYQLSETEISKEYLGRGVGYLTSFNKLQGNVSAPGATQTWNYEIFRRKGDEKPVREYFLVRVIYTDVFSQVTHTTRMCFVETIYGTAEHCATGITMD